MDDDVARRFLAIETALIALNASTALSKVEADVGYGALALHGEAVVTLALKVYDATFEGADPAVFALAAQARNKLESELRRLLVTPLEGLARRGLILAPPASDASN